jgi:hypothetical protein
MSLLATALLEFFSASDSHRIFSARSGLTRICIVIVVFAILPLTRMGQPAPLQAENVHGPNHQSQEIHDPLQSGVGIRTHRLDRQKGFSRAPHPDRIRAHEQEVEVLQGEMALPTGDAR